MWCWCTFITSVGKCQPILQVRFYLKCTLRLIQTWYHPAKYFCQSRLHTTMWSPNYTDHLSSKCKLPSLWNRKYIKGLQHPLPSRPLCNPGCLRSKSLPSLPPSTITLSGAQQLFSIMAKNYCRLSNLWNLALLLYSYHCSSLAACWNCQRFLPSPWSKLQSICWNDISTSLHFLLGEHFPPSL